MALNQHGTYSWSYLYPLDLEALQPIYVSERFFLDIPLLPTMPPFLRPLHGKGLLRLVRRLSVEPLRPSEHCPPAGE
jgi:hypothetical protein